MLHSDWSVDDRQPPTDEDRLEMFSDLAHQYDVATKSLRLMEGNESVPPSDLNHGRLVRAGLIRKFFLGSDTQVHLNKVADSVQVVAECQSAFTDEYRDGCARAKVAYDEWAIKGMSLRNIGGPASRGGEDGFYSPRAIFSRVAYGNVLHADYGKWRQTRTHAAHSYMRSLAITLESMESMLISMIEPVDRLLGEGRGRSQDGAMSVWNMAKK